VDGTGLFKDGEETRSDLPAILSGGADYKITDQLKASGSFNLYFDKNVGWGKNVYGEDRTIDKNYLELALGLEYQLSKTLAVSAGFLNSDTGVSEQYQSDFSYSNDSYTIGAGLQYKIGKKLVLDAGAMLTTYKDASKTFTDATFGEYNETYGKDTFAFGIGLAYKIF
jgi:long-subunit fatty acid transport protein